MEKSTVVVIPCPEYDDEKVYQSLKKALDYLGGIETFVNIDENILVKPNFLSPAGPDAAVTTHPVVTGAVFRILRGAGFDNISYGDSPGHGSSRAVAAKSGTDIYAERYGIIPADMKTEIRCEFPEGRVSKSFWLCKGVCEADAVINVCKMKTHQLEKITGAVKNIYGFVCGARKAAGHVSYSNANSFARMLCDLHRFRSPRLNIMDGITAMEGNGPGSGTPTPMGLIMVSTDPVAIDSLFCRLIYLDPKLVPTNLQGQLFGIGYYELSHISIIISDITEVSEPYEVDMDELLRRFGKPSFDVDRSGHSSRFNFLSSLSSFMTRFTRKPVIDGELCVRCGICVDHCPVPGKAVRFATDSHDAPPRYDYRKCIRCYCCQEMCPRHAIHT